MTWPKLFRRYHTEQIELLFKNQDMPVKIREFDVPIPVYFAYERYIKQEADPTGTEKLPLDLPLRDSFDTPDTAMMDE